MSAPNYDRVNKYAPQLWERSVGLLLILSRERVVVLAAPGVVNSLGYSHSDIEGLRFDDLVCMQLDGLNKAIDAVDGGETRTMTIELGLLSKDGQPRTFQIEVFLLEGDRHEFCLRGWDITKKIEDERSIEIMNKKLSILGSATRHDVLNSLTGLFGYLELAEIRCKDDAVKKYIQKAKLSAETIKVQMEFTRYYQELGLKRPAWINVEESLKVAYSSLNEPRVPMEMSVGRLRILADPMLDKVFFNLMDNVQRHAGANVLKITFTTEDEHGQLVFEDDGTGIPADEKDIIFARGYGRNTGLGLYLVREVLEITGMTIKEIGEPGKGARFVITIPANKFEI
ncbi:MAG: HAMP domain-containing histidine kinase [Euryarchaeota archaeon]|nr:HAMP domain-containing histidine kinase [Euryarchaeota archaeon]